MNKKGRKVRWCVIFTDGLTDGKNPMVKFISKYTDKNNPSVYTDRITNDITIGFKKANHTVTWQFLLR